MLNSKQLFHSLLESDDIDVKDNVVSINSMHSLHISNFIQEGFQHVADVKEQTYYEDTNWELVNYNEQLLFSNHNSWVYVIVEDDTVVKLGESGQPLAIQGPRTFMKAGTQSRFGRLISHGWAHPSSNDTDSRIRGVLKESASQGKVSLYALKCEKVETTYQVLGQERTIYMQVHKDLEKAYLSRLSFTNDLPKLNKGLI